MSCNAMAFFPANFMFQTSQNQEDEHEGCNQQQPPLYPSQNFIGDKRSVPLSGMMEHRNGCGDKNDCHNAEDDLSDDESLPGDQKKKRLNMEQVKTLEKSFEMGNKLEPERKVQLARVLGLQPRQIAIWFQNRRARWKTKQLEKDYDALKRQFDAVKAHNEALQAQNQNLQSQIFALTNGKEGAATTTNVVATELFNLNKETIDQDSCSNRSENENSSEQINNMVKLDMSRAGGGGGASDSPGQIPTSMPLFPTSSSTTAKSLRLTSSSNLPATQLFFQHNQLHNNVKEDNFSNMFCGIEEHSGFWPWLEQQQHFD